MKPFVLLFSLFLGACSSASQRPASFSQTKPSEPASSAFAAQAPNRGLLLVELFTSQGCSACPPADALLRTLPNRYEDVIALAYHVDYWDSADWKDPYSSKAWSKRQAAYAAQVSKGKNYTPQLIVAGRQHAVGSDAQAIEHLLITQKVRAKASIALQATAIHRQGHIEVVVHSNRFSSSRPANLGVALYENNLVTQVARGENRGKALRQDFVVRALQQSPLAAQAMRTEVRFTIPNAWKSQDLGIVVFVQDKESLAIESAQRAVFTQRPETQSP